MIERAELLHTQPYQNQHTTRRGLHSLLGHGASLKQMRFTMTEQSPFLVQVNQTFNVPAPDAFVLEGFSADTTHPNIPVRKDEYVFRKEDLRDVLAFLSN
ncbi:hypothetical protein BOW28_11115 [Solemya velum gill symbiont]|nr:hypothetical protein BOW28_11115 [Solemya velum gill symbiont]